MDGPHGHRVIVGAFVTHDADAFHWQQHGERLPDLRVQTGVLDFVDDNVISFLQQAYAARCHFPHNADGKSRSRKWLPLNDLLTQSQGASDGANLVLEKLTQGLYELQLHRFGKSTNVVMRFDRSRRAFD